MVHLKITFLLLISVCSALGQLQRKTTPNPAPTITPSGCAVFEPTKYDTVYESKRSAKSSLALSPSGGIITFRRAGTLADPTAAGFIAFQIQPGANLLSTTKISSALAGNYQAPCYTVQANPGYWIATITEIQEALTQFKREFPGLAANADFKRAETKFKNRFSTVYTVTGSEKGKKRVQITSFNVGTAAVYYSRDFLNNEISAWNSEKLVVSNFIKGAFVDVRKGLTNTTEYAAAIPPMLAHVTKAVELNPFAGLLLIDLQFLLINEAIP